VNHPDDDEVFDLTPVPVYEWTAEEYALAAMADAITEAEERLIYED
jgi:hypothetical protein